jgi:A/G-specific adenine glycosylase
VGEYTAAAVSTFAFGRGVAMIETNIRSLYLYVFFKGKRMVSDREVLRLVHATMPSRNVREWFYALMDLGVELKKSAPAINHASRHHTRQSSFQGSDRQVAAHVLRVVVTAKTALTRARVAQAVTETLTAATSRQIDRALARLVREGLIVQTARGSVRVA